MCDHVVTAVSTDQGSDANHPPYGGFTNRYVYVLSGAGLCTKAILMKKDCF